MLYSGRAGGASGSRNVVWNGWCLWLLRSLVLFLPSQYDGRPSAEVAKSRDIEFCAAGAADGAFGWGAENCKSKAIAKTQRQ